VPRLLDSTDVPVPDEPTPCSSDDPDHWFPERGTYEFSLEIARAGCFRCWMRPECAAYGLAHPEMQGIWGGLTHKQRSGQKSQKYPATTAPERGRLWA
jgi:hypothetical protein